MKKIVRVIENTNDNVAAYLTLKFGSMWTFYIFFIYGFLPIIPYFSSYREIFFYWSGCIQLWALPLLMVGGIVLNKYTEKRNKEDHLMIMEQFYEIKEMHKELQLLFANKENKNE